MLSRPPPRPGASVPPDRQLEFALRGAVAQLGERRVRNAKVGSSILLRSTIIPSQNSVLHLAV